MDQYAHIRDRIAILKTRATAALHRISKDSPDAGDVHVPTASPSAPKRGKKPYTKAPVRATETVSPKG